MLASKSVTKITLLTYSLNGNTLYAARVLAKGICSDNDFCTEEDIDPTALQKEIPFVSDAKSTATYVRSNFEITIIDLVPIVRYIALSKGKNRNTSNEAHDQALFEYACASVANANAVGVGYMAFMLVPPPGFVEALQAFPASSFYLKPFFLFGTAGNTFSNISNIVAAPLISKNGFYIARYEKVAVPDTCMLFNTDGAHYQWGFNNRKEFFSAGIDFRNRLDKAFTEIRNGSKVVVEPLGSVRRFPFQQKTLHFATKNVVLDKNLCVKCGKCVASCPVNAIKRDIEDFPQFDDSLCYRCTRCLVGCPKNAISVPGLEKTKFCKMTQDSVKTGDNNYSPLTFYTNVTKNFFRMFPLFTTGVCSGVLLLIFVFIKVISMIIY